MAMEKANSIEVPSVIGALEQMSWEGVLGRMSIDQKTHQLIRPYFVVRCKPASDMRHPRTSPSWWRGVRSLSRLN